MQDNKYNILWLGAISWMNKDMSYFPNATYPGIVSGSAFQQSIIEGLEQQNNNVQILTDCDLFSGKRIKWSHNNKSNDVRVAGKKNKILRFFAKTRNLRKELNKTTILNKKDVVIAYEMQIPYLLALKSIKKKNKKIKTVLICPDLSIYMDVDINHKPLKKFLKAIENKIIIKLLKYVDGFVVFTKQMYDDYFSFTNKPYVIVEGVCRNKYPLDYKEKKNYILHAGSLHKNMGIKELIEAFEHMNLDNLELWFCGAGAMDTYILDKCKQNSKIKHLGFVSPNKLFEYEKEAILLINVRNSNESYTKYSFPSKTYEFFMSGTITISTNLSGIPNEYKEHMIIIENNSVDEIIKGINIVLQMSDYERKEFGLSARNFVLENKNGLIQSQKFIDLINKI